MFDVGWSEMAIIAVVALLVFGPKELPSALRSFAQWSKAARKLAREFQVGVDELIREADLDDARKAILATKKDLEREVEKAVDPTGGIGGEVKELVKPGPAADNSIQVPPAVPAAEPEAALEPAAAERAPAETGP